MKYEILKDVKITVSGRELFRIKALIDIDRFGVKAGDLGGYIEKENNLSQDGDAWVYGNARVYGDARVYGNAWVCGDARVCGNAWVCGDADYATVKGFGTKYRNTTFFKCKDGKVGVRCGCFYGTIDEFRTQVKNTRDGKVAKEYLMIADLMEYHFGEDKDNG